MTTKPENKVCIGGEYTYVEMRMERYGDAVFLAADLVYGSPYGREDRDELHSEVFLEEDPEDTENQAIEGGVEIERMARDRLEEMGIAGWKDRGFGEAVQAFLEKTAARPPVAAE